LLRSPSIVIDLAFESHFQYSRKPARCQPTTVLGGDERLRPASQKRIEIAQPWQEKLIDRLAATTR
jgi:hypothetical protein